MLQVGRRPPLTFNRMFVGVVEAIVPRFRRRLASILHPRFIVDNHERLGAVRTPRNSVGAVTSRRSEATIKTDFLRARWTRNRTRWKSIPNHACARSEPQLYAAIGKVVSRDRIQWIAAPRTGHCRDPACGFAIAPYHQRYRNGVHRQTKCHDGNFNDIGQQSHL